MDLNDEYDWLNDEFDGLKEKTKRELFNEWFVLIVFGMYSKEKLKQRDKEWKYMRQKDREKAQRKVALIGLGRWFLRILFGYILYEWQPVIVSHTTAYFLRYLICLCQLRYLLGWFPNLNPYYFPFYLISFPVDPIIRWAREDLYSSKPYQDFSSLPFMLFLSGILSIIIESNGITF